MGTECLPQADEQQAGAPPDNNWSARDLEYQAVRRPLGLHGEVECVDTSGQFDVLRVGVARPEGKGHSGLATTDDDCDDA